MVKATYIQIFNPTLNNSDNLDHNFQQEQQKAHLAVSGVVDIRFIIHTFCFEFWLMQSVIVDVSKQFLSLQFFHLSSCSCHTSEEIHFIHLDNHGHQMSLDNTELPEIGTHWVNMAARIICTSDHHPTLNKDSANGYLHGV